jgi:hypothetical protein
MSEEEIKLDRYAKFRRLGLFEEYVVKGSDWKNARAEREQVQPVRLHAAHNAIKCCLSRTGWQECFRCSGESHRLAMLRQQRGLAKR